MTFIEKIVQKDKGKKEEEKKSALPYYLQRDQVKPPHLQLNRDKPAIFFVCNGRNKSQKKVLATANNSKDFRKSPLVIQRKISCVPLKFTNLKDQLSQNSKNASLTRTSDVSHKKAKASKQKKTKTNLI